LPGISHGPTERSGLCVFGCKKLAASLVCQV
jgi:hypothetical protein